MSHHSLSYPFLDDNLGSILGPNTAPGPIFSTHHVFTRQEEETITNTNEGVIRGTHLYTYTAFNELKGDWEHLFNGMKAPDPGWENHHADAFLHGNDPGEFSISALTPDCSATMLWMGDRIDVIGYLQGVADEELNSTDTLDIYLDGVSVRDQVLLYPSLEQLGLFKVETEHGLHNLTIATGPSLKGNLTLLGIQTHHNTIVEPGREFMGDSGWSKEALTTNTAYFSIPTTLDHEDRTKDERPSTVFEWSTEEEPLTSHFALEVAIMPTIVLHGSSHVRVPVPMNTSWWMLHVVIGPGFGTVYAKVTPELPTDIPLSYNCDRPWYSTGAIMPLSLDPSVEYVVTLSTNEATEGSGVHLMSTSAIPYFLNGTSWWFADRMVDGAYYPDPNITIEYIYPSSESEEAESATSSATVSGDPTSQPVTSETSTSKITTEEPASNDSPSNDEDAETSTIPSVAAVCRAKVK